MKIWTFEGTENPRITKVFVKVNEQDKVFVGDSMAGEWATLISFAEEFRAGDVIVTDRGPAIFGQIQSFDN